jgi:phosphatidyl-myo-inositol alpha-mannosyltransferase
VKIVLVCPYSWSVPGGVANHIDALAGRLRARGHDVTILTPADGPVPMGVISVGRTLGVPFNGSVARIAFGPRVAARLRTALRRVTPDVVHVHEPFAPSAGMIAAAVSRAPVVATFHAAMSQSVVYRAASPVLRPLWRKMAARIAVSDEARRTIDPLFAGELRIVPNGIALERFSRVPAAPGTPHILFIGRFERRKGAAVLLDAFPHVRERVPNATLTMIGEGPERAALERRAEGLPVRFIGRVEPEALADAMRDAAVVCAPSLGGESFGIVLLEAMAAGRPVVASAIPGYAAVVRNGVDGLLVPPGDAGALTAALVEVLTDPERAAAMARSGRERATRYSWDTVAGEIEDVYYQVTRPH